MEAVVELHVTPPGLTIIAAGILLNSSISSRLLLFFVFHLLLSFMQYYMIKVLPQLLEDII